MRRLADEDMSQCLLNYFSKETFTEAKQSVLSDLSLSTKRQIMQNNWDNTLTVSVAEQCMFSFHPSSLLVTVRGSDYKTLLLKFALSFVAV
jgi:hypothetical protein